MTDCRPPSLAIWISAIVVGAVVVALVTLVSPAGSDALRLDLREGIEIRIPRDATADERGAAELMAETLAHASQRPVWRFRIVAAAAGRGGAAPAIFIGPRAAARVPLSRIKGDPAWEPGVGFHVTAQGVVLDAVAPDQLRFAASWFLEETVAARWFIPGALGLETRATDRLTLPFGTRQSRPGYISRELGGTANRPEGRQWHAANRLLPLVTHGHSVAALLGNDVRGPHPELAPTIEGALFVPPADNTSWQPHLAHPMAPLIASRALHREKLKGGFNVVFGLNDSYRYDQTEETLAQVHPFGYFRKVPDYSDLLFGFLNRVAKIMPETLISTYAYYSTENAPSFRVADNIVPFLTADRSMWFDPEFAEQDRELIRRWTRAGPRLVALYDYLYGRPFFVPRPTPWAVTEPIPFAYDEGVRAYFAECSPNWGMDGPKPWLAAQLLWNPQLDPARLIDEYYERFWKEAAEPMRAFFAECDEQWRNQPRPYVWIKYFLDDHQVVLFPPEVRSRLRGHLERARGLARSSVLRERVAFASAAFSVAEAFCAHEEERQRLSRLLLAGEAGTDALLAASARYSAARTGLLGEFRRVKELFPLAVQSELVAPYVRSDPRGKVIAELGRRGALGHLTRDQRAALFGTELPQGDYTGWSDEILVDAKWAEVRKRNADPFVATEWFQAGRWSNRSEPWQSRSLELVPNGDGGQRIRIAESANETIWQWHRAQAGERYLASVGVRGRVSPGNFTFLLVSFQDQQGKLIGSGHTDRLPPGEWDGARLEVLVQVPPNAVEVSLTLRVMLQMDGDWVEFDTPSLRRALAK